MSNCRIQKSKQSTQPNSSQPVKVPRPMNCFLMYRQDKQKEILEKCPGANHRDISKIISKWWKEATEEEKKPYMKKAALAKLEHARRYPSYKYMPQKKSKNGTRTYKRRTQDEFTSKSKKLNDFMKQIYYNGDSSVLSRLSTNQMPPHADLNADIPPSSIPTISMDSLSVSPMNTHSPFTSPSSLSLSSSSSPSYIPYSYPDCDVIYHSQEAMMDPSFFLMNDGPNDLYGSLSIDSSSLNNMDIPHMNFLGGDTALDNMCVATQYYLQHPPFDFDSCGVYSSGYDSHQYNQQLDECTLSPSDLYMHPPSTFYTLSHPDYPQPSSDSLL